MLYFMNEGEFDVDAMLTFGVSAKAGENRIGRFGTGFKYAVAITLRLGGTIEVNTKGSMYKFTKESKEIRGKNQEIVYMNGRNAGFTTHIGFEWDTWMAYRELYCNTLDEDGVVDTKKASYDTIITVDCKEIEEIHSNRSQYFLDRAETPLFETDNLEVYPGPSNRAYYQGVYVGSLPGSYSSVYTYNFKKGVALDEMRTYRFGMDLETMVARCVQQDMPKRMLRKLFNQPKSFEVSNLRVRYGISEDFSELCTECLKTEAGLPERIRKLCKELSEEDGAWPTFKLKKLQEDALCKSERLLKTIGVNVRDYPINFVTGLGTGVMGRAYEGEIYISELAFSMGTKQLASTLLEEYVHLKLGCADFDRTMQNYLFDKVLSLTEEINQELF